MVLFPQFCALLLDSFALSRGKFMDMVASAFNLSVNSKPMGIVGLKASPSRISRSVTLAMMGSGVIDDPGNP